MPVLQDCETTNFELVEIPLDGDIFDEDPIAASQAQTRGSRRSPRPEWEEPEEVRPRPRRPKRSPELYRKARAVRSQLTHKEEEQEGLLRHGLAERYFTEKPPVVEARYAVKRAGREEGEVRVQIIDLQDLIARSEALLDKLGIVDTLGQSPEKFMHFSPTGDLERAQAQMAQLANLPKVEAALVQHVVIRNVDVPNSNPAQPHGVPSSQQTDLVLDWPKFSANLRELPEFCTQLGSYTRRNLNQETQLALLEQGLRGIDEQVQQIEMRIQDSEILLSAAIEKLKLATDARSIMLAHRLHLILASLKFAQYHLADTQLGNAGILESAEKTPLLNPGSRETVYA